MVVLVEKFQGPAVRLDWGNGQTKNDMPTDIFCQWRTSLRKLAILLEEAPTKQVFPQSWWRNIE